MAFRAPYHRSDFFIGIICAIPIEYDALCLVVDEFWDVDGDRYGRAIGDCNTYTTARIGKHNVVIALLPQMGKVNSAASAANFRSSYNNVELLLLVSICGGVPYSGVAEILLGDVVISKYIVQHDFGSKYTDEFIRKNTVDDNLSKTNKNVRGLLSFIETARGQELLQAQTASFLLQLQTKAAAKSFRGRGRRNLNYCYPGLAKDQLFRSNYIHKHHSPAYNCKICESNTDAVCDYARHAICDDVGCNINEVITRKALKEKREPEHDNAKGIQEPTIHFGIVASGDTVMKCGLDRDRIAKDEGIIAFEMEGAGIWEEIPCIIVKGVCDYADSHKNNAWQNFAAATAASAAKALLGRYILTDISRPNI
ncbi:nucleoside phosphorylase domain-containing protein [Trichoderma evansii]